jgi:hypothetical protein
MLTQINLASLSNDPFYQIFDNKKGTRWLLVSPKFIKYLSNGWDSSSFGLCPLSQSKNSVSVIFAFWIYDTAVGLCFPYYYLLTIH